MATHAIMIEWGMPIEGRESKALEEFMSTMGWFTQLQEGSKIERFATYGTLTGNMADRTGLAIVEGSKKQIDALRHDEEYRVRLNRLITIGHNIQIQLLETGDQMPTRMMRYGKVVKEIGG